MIKLFLFAYTVIILATLTILKGGSETEEDEICELDRELRLMKFEK